MTLYESLMTRSDECLGVALTFSDENLKRFWKNASDEFRERARNLFLWDGWQEVKL
jgi:hypothetical protein